MPRIHARVVAITCATLVCSASLSDLAAVYAFARAAEPPPASEPPPSKAPAPPAPARQAQHGAGSTTAYTPAFRFNVMSLSGGPLSSADFKGKILVVDVWATWCGPCRMVIPHLVRLREKYKSRGVEVIGLSVDEPSPDGKGYPHVTSFVADHAIKYPIGLMNGEAYRDLIGLMRADPRTGFSIPTTVVMGRDGRLLKLYPGYFQGQERELERVIEKALAAEAPPPPKR